MVRMEPGLTLNLAISAKAIHLFALYCNIDTSSHYPQ